MAYRMLAYYCQLISSTLLKKILCVGAHPDDLELGLGGTIAKHVDKKHEVHLVICTQGIGG